MFIDGDRVYATWDEFFNVRDRKRNTPEGKLAWRKYVKKRYKRYQKNKKQIAKRKSATEKWNSEIAISIELPLVIVNLIDEYLRLRCPNCSTNIFPMKLRGWNTSSWDDTSSLLEEKTCSRRTPNSNHLRSAECLINKFEKINGLEGGPQFLMHLQAHKLDYGNYMGWSIHLKKLNSCDEDEDTSRQSEHPFSKLKDVDEKDRLADSSAWSSITSHTDLTLEILRYICMTDEDLTNTWRSADRRMNVEGGGRLISCLRAQLISNLESLFD